MTAPTTTTLVTTTATTRRASVRKSSSSQQTKPTCASGEELPRDVRCEYPSKFCNSHKALKGKGGVHKFCEYHRRKANLNQKRWQQRRREMREQRDQDRQKYADRAAAPESMAVPVMTAKATSQKLERSAELMALTPSDVIEPFPISNFTTTPPPTNEAATAQYVMPMTTYMATFDPSAFQYGASAFTADEDLDVLSTLFFNDVPANAYAMYDWPVMDAPSSGYTLTGAHAAIV